jgi:hypothetical protein
VPPYDWQDDPEWDDPKHDERVGLLYLLMAFACIAGGMILLYWFASSYP